MNGNPSLGRSLWPLRFRKDPTVCCSDCSKGADDRIEGIGACKDQALKAGSVDPFRYGVVYFFTPLFGPRGIAVVSIIRTIPYTELSRGKGLYQDTFLFFDPRP